MWVARNVSNIEMRHNTAEKLCMDDAFIVSMGGNIDASGSPCFNLTFLQECDKFRLNNAN